MSKYIDNLVSLKTENMMGSRLSTHKGMAQVLNQVRASRRLVLVGYQSVNEELRGQGYLISTNPTLLFKRGLKCIIETNQPSNSGEILNNLIRTISYLYNGFKVP